VIGPRSAYGTELRQIGKGRIGLCTEVQVARSRRLAHHVAVHAKTCRFYTGVNIKGKTICGA
jgi:hypothetical protein